MPEQLQQNEIRLIIFKYTLIMTSTSVLVCFTNDIVKCHLLGNRLHVVKIFKYTYVCTYVYEYED